MQLLEIRVRSLKGFVDVKYLFEAGKVHRGGVKLLIEGFNYLNLKKIITN